MGDPLNISLYQKIFKGTPSNLFPPKRHTTPRGRKSSNSVKPKDGIELSQTHRLIFEVLARDGVYNMEDIKNNTTSYENFLFGKLIVPEFQYKIKRFGY